VVEDCEGGLAEDSTADVAATDDVGQTSQTADNPALDTGTAVVVAAAVAVGRDGLPVDDPADADILDSAAAAAAAEDSVSYAAMAEYSEEEAAATDQRPVDPGSGFYLGTVVWELVPSNPMYGYRPDTSGFLDQFFVPTLVLVRKYSYSRIQLDSSVHSLYPC